MKKSITFLIGTFVASSLLFPIQEGKAKELKRCTVRKPNDDTFDLVLKQNKKGIYVVKTKGSSSTRFEDKSYEKARAYYREICKRKYSY
tara:strand:+ start:224 stop:490 length:267 start_codon:yes stop_codon:yes gene_type:complete